ncbi:MAG: DMT family transporter [Acidobacteriaceae bacterium]
MQKKSIVQILVLSAIWGVSFLLIRIAGESFPPFWIALLRCGLGALLLWGVLFGTGHRAPARSHLRWLLLVGLFNNAIPFTCFAWGERVVPSNTAAVLNATTPIFTLLLGMALQRGRAAWNVMAGVALGFAGVVLVVVNQQSSAAQAQVPRAAFFRGVALVTTGALGYAIGALIAKAKLQGIDPIGIAASQLGLAGLMVLPLAVFGPHPANVHPGPVLGVAVLGLLGSGVAYLLFFHVLRTVPATHAVAVTYLLPIWGVFWGAIAHERIGIPTYAGVAVVIAGLVLMNLRRTPAGALLPLVTSRSQDAAS